MSEERTWRIVGHNDDAWRVQYGYYSARGSTRRFMALAEWAANNLEQAHVVVAREKINLALKPLPVDAKPLPGVHAVRRTVNQTRSDGDALIRQAVEGLADPLPTVEQSHQKLGVEVPQSRGAGRQFYAYLREPVYGLLCAMAVNANTSRNQIIEALILSAAEGS